MTTSEYGTGAESGENMSPERQDQARIALEKVAEVLVVQAGIASKDLGAQVPNYEAIPADIRRTIEDLDMTERAVVQKVLGSLRGLPLYRDSIIGGILGY